MLKKEITDTLKQTGFVLSFLLLVPVVYWINSMRLTNNQPFSHYAGAGIMLSFLLLVFTLAYQMFSSEDSDNASEYLKSLPITGWKLLSVKIAPRLAVTWIFLFGYCLFIWSPPAQISGSNNFFRTGYSVIELLAALIFTLQVLLWGFLLGVSDRKNPVLALVILGIAMYPLVPGPVLALSFFDNFLVYQRSQLFILISLLSVILLPPLTILLIMIPKYNSWDCTSSKIKSQQMLKRIALPAALVAGLWGFAFTQI